MKAMTGALAALLLGACNQGGIMELELLLPPAPTAFDLGPCDAGGGCSADSACEEGRCVYRGEWYSQVEITSQFRFVDSGGLVNQWDVGQRVGDVPLGSGSDRWSCTSVLGDQTVDVVRLRLRYCRTTPCVETLESDTIESWFEIERPFYDGKRTYVRRRAPSIAADIASCSMDAQCTGPEGPVCLSSLRCGCDDDAQCPGGHCEGVTSTAGEGRCTTDVSRCHVAGCIFTDRLLENPNLCLGLGAGMEQHPCETSPTEEYDRVTCYQGD